MEFLEDAPNLDALIIPIGGGGLIAAAKGTPSIRMRVYTGTGADLGDLAVSKEFVIAPKDQIGWLGARGQLVDGQYYVMAGNGLQRLDLVGGQWATITPGERISSHRVDVTSGVITALWSQGAFSKVYVSSDKGTTWAARVAGSAAAEVAGASSCAAAAKGIQPMP